MYILNVFKSFTKLSFIKCKNTRQIIQVFPDSKTSCTTTTKLKILDCNSVSDICDEFIAHRTSWNPSDLISIIFRILHISIGGTRSSHKRNEAIDILNAASSAIYKQDFKWNSNDCYKSLDNIDLKLNIMQLDKRVSDIYSDIIKKFDFFSVSQILYINKISKYIRGYHNQIIRGDSERRLGADLWNLSNEDLCMTAVILVEKSNNIEFVKLFIHVILNKFKDLTTDQRVLIFTTLSNSKCSKLFLESATRSILQFKDTFNNNDLIKILACYARKPSSCSDVFFKNLLKSILQLDVSLLELEYIYDLIWITCKYTNEGKNVLERAHSTLLQNVKNMTSRNVTLVLWALSNSKYKSHVLVNALEQRAIETSDSMNPTSMLTLRTSSYNTLDIAHCIHSLGLLLDFNDEKRFHKHVDGVIVENIHYFNGLDLALTVYGYSSLLCGSITLHQCLQEACMKYLDDMPADCITKILHSYAIIGGKESLFLSFQFPFMQRVHQFPIHELCTVLWSFATMKIYDLSFWRFATSIIDPAQVIDEPRCALLFPSLSIISKVHPTMANTDSTRLMNHTRRHFWDLQFRNFNKDYADDVVELLKQMDVTDIEQCIDYDGFLVDVMFSKKYAVSIYSTRNTFGNDYKPTGDMLIREHFLIKNGLKIIRILYSTWVKMDTGDKSSLIKQQMTS